MTFNDLAKELNLSTATISRALSRPEIVAPQTRTRVLDAVRRSGYQMNGIARSLRTQSTQTIGIIVSDICNPFFSAIVKAVEDVARTNGFTVLICNADEEGFRKTLRTARISIPRNYIECGDFREASGYRAAERLLSLPFRPTAIFVANNEMMAGTLLAVRQRKVKVPRELSLVGFDDARWARYLEPPLTVVSQPAERMGEKAAQLLLTRLDGRETAQTVVFEPELIVRRSSAEPRS